MSDTYSKLRNEVMAGGADNPDAEATAGGQRAVLGLAVIFILLVALYLWSGWAFIFVVGSRSVSSAITRCCSRSVCAESISLLMVV